MGSMFARPTRETATMISTRLIRCFLLNLLLIVFTASAYEFCEDRSTTIEKGYVQCTLNNYGQPQVRCRIECLPGLIAYPQAEIHCSSSGSRILRIDANGQRSYITTGTWNGNITTAECRVPTSCVRFKDPKHGSKTCTSKGDTRTCLRTCQYPFEVSEPLHQREQCGPHTNFVWSHVIRHNSTEVPPCFLPQKCRALQETDFPEHGQMKCKYEAWADTTICKLDCERGYVPKDNTKTEVFCGPTTAFIWSQVHVHKNSYARIEGCKQSPITAEVTLDVETPCEGISISEKEEGAQKLKSYLRSKVLHLDKNSKSSFIGWNSYCTDKVVQRVVNDNVINTTRQDSNGDNSVQLNHGENLQSSDKLHSSAISLDVNLSGPSVTQIDPVSSTSNPPRSTTVPTGDTGDTEETVKNGHTVNVTVSELTYSLYYKTVCNGGQCKEACRVLNLTQNQLCKSICLQKVRAFHNSQENQVKVLQTLHIGKLMSEVDFPTDVSTAYSAINGTKFKSLNVTTVAMKIHNVNEYQAGQMRQQSVSYSSSYGNDPC